MARILLTAFEPFDGADTNPSEAVAARVAEHVDGVTTVTLPVSFERARHELAAVLHREQPDIALGLGLAGNRDVVSFERLAVNIADARIPDNDGVQHSGIELTPGDAIARWTNLPVKAAFAELDGAGVELSMSAGTYVCNAVFYDLMQWAETSGTKAGFVHVPPCESADQVEECASAVATLLRLTREGVVEAAVPVGHVS